MRLILPEAISVSVQVSESLCYPVIMPGDQLERAQEMFIYKSAMMFF